MKIVNFVSEKLEEIVLILWFVFFEGYAVFKVNSIPECDNTPYGWDIVYVFFIIMAFPTILGYLIGIKRGK